MVQRMIREAKARLALIVVDDSGMSTVEYAIGTNVIYPWNTRLITEKCLLNSTRTSDIGTYAVYGGIKVIQATIHSIKELISYDLRSDQLYFIVKDGYMI